jgi:DNA repair protein RadC
MPRKKENELKVVNIRLVKEPSLYSDEPIKSSEDVMKVIAKELASYDREVFLVLNLKLNGQVINMNICSVGTLTNSLVSARDVFKSAILSNAGAFIAVHNHPTGGLEPSQDDKDITKMLLQAGRIMDIKMVDHIIVAGETGEMYSFQREGLMDQLEWEKAGWER